MKKLMSQELRIKVKKYIKNRLDISFLIKDVIITGEDLTGAIISDFDRHDENISNCNFARAILGHEGKITNWNRIKANNVCFKGTLFKGTFWARRAIARNCNFTNAYMPYFDYKFADLRGSTFCDTVFSIGTRKGVGAIFDEGLFKELSKFWGVEVRKKSEEQNGKS